MTVTGYEILEHTADVGVESRGPTAETAFEQATLGLLAIADAWAPGAPEHTVEVEVAGSDRAAVLVAWLGEVLYQQDALDQVVTSVEVQEVSDTAARGRLGLAPRRKELEGTAIKAVTYHQLQAAETPDGWVCRVFLDI